MIQTKFIGSRTGLVLLFASLLFFAAGCAPTQAGKPGTALYTGKPYDGPLYRIAVVAASAPSKFSELESVAYSAAVDALMSHPYFASRFDFVDRENLEQLLGEMSLGASGVIDPLTVPAVGKMVGAQYILLVELVSADLRPLRLSGIHLGNISLGGDSLEIEVTMKLSMLHVESGRLVATVYSRYREMAPTGLSVGDLRIGSTVSERAIAPLIERAATDLVDKLAKVVDLRMGL